MVRAFKRWKDGTGKGILNKLKTFQRSVRKIIEKRIAVIEFRRNKRICQENCRIEIKRRANLAKLSNLEKRRATYVRNM